LQLSFCIRRQLFKPPSCVLYADLAPIAQLATAIDDFPMANKQHAANETAGCHIFQVHVVLCRRISDMNMMMTFGDGKERSKQQFEVLLAAAGFKLTGITPTNGMFVVLEAIPV